MTRRAQIVSVAALAALAAALLWATEPRTSHRRPRRNASLARLFAPARIPPLAPAEPRRKPNSAVVERSRLTRSSTPRAVARAFVNGWLACTYHHRSCAALRGALPAYAAALSRQREASLATPAEQAARPKIVALHITRSCTASAIATAAYQDGEGGTFELHLNLVHGPEGWRVFDVAEAPPHIPLPTPLSRGPRGC